MLNTDYCLSSTVSWLPSNNCVWCLYILSEIIVTAVFCKYSCNLFHLQMCACVYKLYLMYKPVHFCVCRCACDMAYRQRSEDNIMCWFSLFVMFETGPLLLILPLYIPVMLTWKLLGFCVSSSAICHRNICLWEDTMAPDVN